MSLPGERAKYSRPTCQHSSGISLCSWPGERSARKLVGCGVPAPMNRRVRHAPPIDVNAMATDADIAIQVAGSAVNLRQCPVSPCRIHRPTPPPADSVDDLDPAHRPRRLKRKVKSRHKPILDPPPDSHLADKPERWGQNSAYDEADPRGASPCFPARPSCRGKAVGDVFSIGNGRAEIIEDGPVAWCRPDYHDRRVDRAAAGVAEDHDERRTKHQRATLQAGEGSVLPLPER